VSTPSLVVGGRARLTKHVTRNNLRVVIKHVATGMDDLAARERLVELIRRLLFAVER
jgi:hypothetical protein